MEKNARYEFDLGTLCKRVEALRSALGPEVRLAYAIKANPFLVRGLMPYVDRFEICSPGESRICDGAGVPYEKTVISGVYKTPSFLEALAANTQGRLYTVESWQQFQLLRRLAQEYGKPLDLLLRLTNDSQFGMDAELIEKIVAERENYPLLKLRGIQYFSGTQKTSVKKLRRELDQLGALMEKLSQAYGFRVQELEYGPGFPVSYFGEEFDEAAFLGDFRQLLNDFSVACEITLELGRSIAASCGKYCTPIVDIKRNKGQNYLLVDGGMHHLSYFGQYMGMKLPEVSVLGKEDAPTCENWNVCGSLCSMNDILVKQLPLPEVALGDELCFANTGAYSMTEGISLFLSRDLPEIYIIQEDGTRQLVRERFETYPLNTYAIDTPPIPAFSETFGEGTK